MFEGQIRSPQRRATKIRKMKIGKEHEQITSLFDLV